MSAMAEIDGEKNKHYPKGTTTLEKLESGNGRPIPILLWFETGNALFIFFRKQ